MEPFSCPKCSHSSSFDPLAGPAVCPQCGYSPPKDIRVSVDLVKEAVKQVREQHPKKEIEIGESLLDELLSYWQGTHVPDRDFQLITRGEAYAFFEEYQRALGEDPKYRPGLPMRYVRSYQPEKKAILRFVGAYQMLKHGQRTRAVQYLRELTRTYPDFPDPWVWLSATTEDPAERIDYLENAVLLEPAHPLARDALAIAQGKVLPAKAQAGPPQEDQVSVTNCPHCGGPLHYEPGATEVECQYCGRRLELEETNLIHGPASLIGDLRLRRRLHGHTWREVGRIVHCKSCGAKLSMTHHLAKQCVFCGSTSVLVEDNQQTFEQPDGFLPFKLGKEQAVAAIGRAQRSVSQRLKTWWSGQEQEIKGLEAVYLPFWVFDGIVEVRKPLVKRPDRDAQQGWAMLGGGGAMHRSSADGVWMVSRLDRPPPESGGLLGKELLVFDNLLYSAMDFPPPHLLKEILPFGLGALVPYEPRLLADWPAALYHRDVEVVVKGAYNAMLGQAVWQKKSLVLSQAGDLAQLRRTLQITTVSYQLVLLPVWVALAQRADELRLALANGQTGKVAFSSPLRARSE